ncbi:MAG: hypothetical protein ABI091_26595 [Ferruginibacter sp.]
MFKVVCIKKGRLNPISLVKGISHLVEGEIYTVKRKLVGINDKHEKIDAYELIEITGTNAADLFIPLSDIDETEFERNYNTEKIKL